ncbi:phosphinothricin acetyltransferase [Flaviramulus basaltis]|uniref:Phosphinothricin acetyltransferase n=1 Tax=Flaviramulus basaltis TaxID=369401 RepID=A0A1K2IMJ2_9FLAO|nr:GNAT family N-acetyltransferase [Flaviramulus basaltis]SFZ92891.1 phosphinothricin acetyltransferase [Flaviramulus basaltis]
MIRNVHIEDAQQLVDIYNYYVLNTIVTFDDVPFTNEDFNEKINTISKSFPFIVFEEDDKILGYAYANKWREKPAYKQTVESTVYLHHEAQGKQIGTKLYTELLAELKNQNYHVIVGGLTLPNDASVKLHEKFGFKQVAHFKEVGFKFNKWLDVGFWQLNL